MRNNYKNSYSDFTKARAHIESFVLDHVEESQSEQASFMEYDIQRLCRKLYPSTVNLGIRLFVEMFFHALLYCDVQFSFRREGNRSRFSGIMLKGSNEPSSKAVSGYPRRSYPRGSDNQSADDFEDDSLAHSEKDSIDDYVTLDTGGKIPVSSLRKLYEAVGTDDDHSPFSDFLDRYLAGKKCLSLTKKPASSGKTKRYISGLRLNKKGRAVIDSLNN